MNHIISIMISIAIIIATYGMFIKVENDKNNMIIDNYCQSKECISSYLDDGKIFIINNVMYVQYKDCVYYCKKLQIER